MAPVDRDGSAEHPMTEAAGLGIRVWLIEGAHRSIQETVGSLLESG